MTRPSNAPAYEEDFVAWLEDQAQHARRGEIDALDLENIAEELEGMARSDRREIRNRLTILLAHLLKCWVQPHKRSSSWRGTIAEQRDHLVELIEDSPSFRTPPKSSTGTIRRLVGRLHSRCGRVKAPSPHLAPSLSARFSISVGSPLIRPNKER